MEEQETPETPAEESSVYAPAPPTTFGGRLRSFTDGIIGTSSQVVGYVTEGGRYVKDNGTTLILPLVAAVGGVMRETKAHTYDRLVQQFVRAKEAPLREAVSVNDAVYDFVTAHYVKDAHFIAKTDKLASTAFAEPSARGGGGDDEARRRTLLAVLKSSAALVRHLVDETRGAMGRETEAALLREHRDACRDVDEARDVIFECVEQSVCRATYDEAYELAGKCAAESDACLREQLVALAPHASATFLGVFEASDSLRCNGERMLQAAEVLARVCEQRSPREKLQALGECCALLVDSFYFVAAAADDAKDARLRAASDGNSGERRRQVGADTLLPALILLTLRAQPRRLQQDLCYISSYRDAERLDNDYYAYIYASTAMCVAFIESLVPEKVAEQHRASTSDDDEKGIPTLEEFRERLKSAAGQR